jgi:hypothetical protein
MACSLQSGATWPGDASGAQGLNHEAHPNPRGSAGPRSGPRSRQRRTSQPNQRSHHLLEGGDREEGVEEFDDPSTEEEASTAEPPADKREYPAGGHPGSSRRPRWPSEEELVFLLTRPPRVPGAREWSAPEEARGRPPRKGQDEEATPGNNLRLPGQAQREQEGGTPNVRRRQCRHPPPRKAAPVEKQEPPGKREDRPGGLARAKQEARLQEPSCHEDEAGRQSEDI